MTLIAEIHFTMTKPDADPNDVTKALRMYFDDNDLWHDPQLIMCGLTSPTQWPMSPTGDKPKITLDREGNATADRYRHRHPSDPSARKGGLTT